MTEQMIKTLIANAPLVVALGTAYWLLTPRLLKATLSNGGGEIVRRIVREENALQAVEHRDMVQGALGASEARTTAQVAGLGETMTRVRERLSTLEGRITDHLAVGRP